MLKAPFASRTFHLLGGALALSLLTPGFASFEGIPENTHIREMSRPCCSFAQSAITRRIGITGVIDPNNLGEHRFGRQKGFDNVGLMYTCRSGFVDISHLRDNADWAATIYRTLLNHLGRGVSLEVVKETPVKAFTLELPALPENVRASYTREQIARMAVSLTFDIGLYHEIATFFPQVVTGPRIPVIGPLFLSERMSAFSLEDVYSNLLGATLGVMAADSPEPYDAAMTKLLAARVADAEALPVTGTEAVFQSLKGKWWNPGIRNYRLVRRRNFDHGSLLEPKLPQNELIDGFCANAGSVIPLSNPGMTEVSGLDFRSVAYLRAVPDKSYAKKLRSLGIALNPDGSFTREQFPAVIEAMKNWFLKKIPESLDY